MKKLVLVAVLLAILPVAVHSANAGIAVGSPSPGSRWCLGQDASIAWSCSGDWGKFGGEPGYRQVEVVLLAVNSRLRPMVISAGPREARPLDAAAGTFVWRVPGDTAPGEYRVQVRTVNRLIVGESGTFSIANCAPEFRGDVVAFNARSGRISGHISGFDSSHLLAGRKVRVLLRKAGALVASAEFTLNSQGSADYQFDLLTVGSYGVSVEKVASPANNPSLTLNVCFNGTAPAQRAVTLAGGSMTASGQDFSIQYAIAFNMSSICW